MDLDAGSNTVKVAVSNDGLTTTYTVKLLRLVTQQQGNVQQVWLLPTSASTTQGTITEGGEIIIYLGRDRDGGNDRVRIEVTETGNTLTGTIRTSFEINNGGVSDFLTLNTQDDEAVEADSVVTVRLLADTADPQTYALIDPPTTDKSTSHSVTVLDNDEAQPALYATVRSVSGGKKATLRWADPDGCASKYHVYIQIEDNQSNWLTATSDGSAVDLSSSTMEWSHTFPTLIHGSTGLKIGVWCDASSQDNVATPPGRQVGGTVTAFFTAGSAGNAPVEPGSVAAKAAGDGELALSWTAPSNQSATPIKSSIVQYQVQWKSGSEDWDATNRQAVSELPPHLTHTIGGLTGGTAYTVRVRAVSASHDGAWSEGSAGTPAGVTNNAATGEPTISGTNLVGQAQTANKGSIADADGLPLESTFTYQWIRVSSGSEADISGATSKTYTPVTADAGKKLKVKVGFTDNASNAESRTSSASEIIGAITCTPTAPQAAIWSACLTVDVGGYYFEDTGVPDNYGALSNPEFTVDGTTYTFDTLQTFTTSLFLIFTTAPGNAATGWVLHIGSASTSFAFSAATSSDAGKQYVWSDSGLSWSDGDVISVWLAAAAAANNEATGEPTISGANLVGQTLTANKGSIADADGLPLESTFSYQWIRVSGGSEADISGATSKTYTPVTADEGKKLKVKVGFTDNAGNDESRTSAASLIIGATTCTPTAPQDAIWSACLTADAGGYNFDRPGSVDNQGALSSTDFTVGGTTYTVKGLYALTPSLILVISPAPGSAASGWALHIGSADQFDLSAATNPGGGKGYTWADANLTWSDEQVISVWLAEATNSAATGAPTISGTNLVGQTQTANQGSIADADGLPLESTFTYQWIRVSSGSEADISGATSKTYTTVAADVGKKLKVKVDFTDNASNAESRTSSASEIIGAITCTPTAPPDAIWVGLPDGRR